jgi:hypothetical protein
MMDHYRTSALGQRTPEGSAKPASGGRKSPDSLDIRRANAFDSPVFKCGRANAGKGRRPTDQGS